MESRLQAFEKKVKSQWVNERALQRLLSYLRQETDELPLEDTRRYRDFQELDMLLAPFQHWAEPDQRVFRFMTAKGWAYERKLGQESIREGFYLSFFRWYGQQLAAGAAPDWEIIEQMLVDCGIPQEDLLGQLLEGIDAFMAEMEAAENPLIPYIYQQLTEAPERLAYALQHNRRNGAGLCKIIGKYLTLNQVSLHPEIAKKGFLHPEAWRHYPQLIVKRLTAFLQEYPSTADVLFEKAMEIPTSGLGKILLAKAIASFFPKEGKNTILHLVREAMQSQATIQWSYYDLETEHRIDLEKELISWLLEYDAAALKEEIISYLSAKKIGYKRDFTLEQLAISAYGQDAVPVVARFLEHKPTETYSFGPSQTAYHIIKSYDLTAYEAVFASWIQSGMSNFMQLGARALNEIWGEQAWEKWEALLASKDKTERKAAVFGLIALNDKASHSLLLQTVEKEKEDAIRNEAAAHLFTLAELTDIIPVQDRIEWAEKRGKFKRPAARWLDEQSLPSLFWQNGEALSPEAIRYLLYIQKDWQPVSIQPEAKAFFAAIDTDSSGDFAWALLRQIMQNGGLYAKNRFAMLPIALLGDERIIPVIQTFCIEKKNPTAASLLAFQTSLEAARALDAIMLAFKSKYPNVREAAQEAFDQIAENRGMSRFELMDEMIPNLGFEGLFRTFEDKGKTYRAFVGKNLKMQFLDAENNIKKSLPASVSPDLKNDIKTINKSLRELTKGLKERLERALVLQRRWKSENWQTFFLHKPLPFAMARALVWGIYEGEKLLESFSVTDDQLFENAAYDEIDLPEGSHIGLVHPLELDEAKKTTWQVYLKENKLKAVFAQLERPVFLLREEEKGQKQLTRFEGKKAKITRFKSRMEKAGWRRGAVMDGGIVENYFLPLASVDIDASLALENMGVTIEDYEAETTLEELVFVAHEGGRSGAYGTYWYREHEQNLLRLGEIPEVLISEVLADIEGLLG